MKGHGVTGPACPRVEATRAAAGADSYSGLAVQAFNEHSDFVVVDFGSPSLQSQSLLFGFIAHPFRRRLL